MLMLNQLARDSYKFGRHSTGVLSLVNNLFKSTILSVSCKSVTWCLSVIKFQNIFSPSTVFCLMLLQQLNFKSDLHTSQQQFKGGIFEVKIKPITSIDLGLLNYFTISPFNLKKQTKTLRFNFQITVVWLWFDLV